MTIRRPLRYYINSLSEYDAKIISAKNCIALLIKYKATPKFIDLVKNIIKYFEKLEEYEKCATLKNYLKYNKEKFVY